MQIWDRRTLTKRDAFETSDSVRFLRFDAHKIVVYARDAHKRLSLMVLTLPMLLMGSGTMGNIIEVWSHEGKLLNKVFVTGSHSGNMTGVLHFQVSDAFAYIERPWVSLNRHISSVMQYDERWLVAGLHATAPGCLALLDFFHESGEGHIRHS